MSTFTFRGATNAPYRLVSGNVSAPSLAFANATSTGFFHVNGNIGISINGTEKVRLAPNVIQVTGNVTANGYTGSGTLLTGWSSSANSYVSNVQIANSTYSVLDDTAVSNNGYVIVNGSGFVGGSMVLIGGTPATSTSVASYTQLRAQVPSKAAGTDTLTVMGPDSSLLSVPLAITYSPVPVWSTGSTLANVTKYTAFTQTLSATEASNANVTYALAAGSSLPANVTLSSNGVLSGNILTDPGNTTVFSFVINAIDAQLQDIPRTFGLTALLVSQFPVTYLVVAGGGGGGSAGSSSNRGAGGGGGGGYVSGSLVITRGVAYTVTIGAGGNGASNAARANGAKGINSVLASVTAEGGGYGSSQVSASLGDRPGGNGGCGGGAGDMGGTGGTGSQGYAGGSASVSTGTGAGGGGGGGAGSLGTNSLGDGNNGVAAGGSGLTNAITGASVTYAAGGNGGTRTGASGGASGTANTGNGGAGASGGASLSAGGNGGSGIVIISYTDTLPPIASITGTLAYSTPTVAGYKVYMFTTGTGTITI